ncbi:MAG: hypothetical protein HQK84_02740 [Nitrospinae bacterium]|nr:hypothetical protein [Nitrospinota bacterium]
MYKNFFLFLIFFLYTPNLYASEIIPSDVYREVYKIHEEIDIIKKHFGITKGWDNEETPRVDANLKPRHVWQKAYLILVKINILRMNLKLPRIEEVGIEPMLELHPNMVYEMTQRILVELRIIKKLYNISSKIEEAPIFTNKKPLDVFNFLHHVSLEMDLLNEHQLTPTDTYAQVKRLYDDITIILDNLEVMDKTIPPEKNKNSTTLDAFNAVFEFLEIIQNIQKTMGLERVDYFSFKSKKPEPADVVNLVGMATVELQVIKAFLGMTHEVTPPARHYYAKQPADVEQLIRWCIERMKLIRTLKEF